MIFHASLAADRPQHVASVIAELWKGSIAPFPPVATGSWMAMAGDDRGSIIEVYERDVRLSPADGDADAVGLREGIDERSASHLAIASPLSSDEIAEIGTREGWITKYRKRGDIFGVIEFWIENRFMVEVLTADMQAEYLGAFGRAGNPQAALAHGPGLEPAPTPLN